VGGALSVTRHHCPVPDLVHCHGEFCNFVPHGLANRRAMGYAPEWRLPSPTGTKAMLLSANTPTSLADATTTAPLMPCRHSVAVKRQSESVIVLAARCVH
jgi:hypothetical protein